MQMQIIANRLKKITTNLLLFKHEIVRPSKYVPLEEKDRHFRRSMYVSYSVIEIL